jgi:hypothetical protein
VDNAIDIMLLHQGQYGIEITDVGLDKCVVWRILNIGKICQIAGIGQFVEVDDVVVRIFVYKEANYVAADKSGTAGNDD